MFRRAFVVISLVLLGAGVAMPAAHTQSAQPVFGLRPSLYGKTTLEKGHFQYAVKAGSSVQDAVEVVNLTNERLTVELYPADMDQAPDGSLSPKQEDDPRRSVGAWLTLERASVSVPAEAKKYVAFSVKVPDGTPPGDHLGAVVGTVRSRRATDGLTVESRVALTARVRIPGKPTLATDIGPLVATERGRSKVFTVELRNTGNLFFTTKGTIDISSDGRRVTSLRLSPPDVYLIPNGRARFTATWASPPLYGNRTAVASFDTTSPGTPFERISTQPVTMSFFSWTIPLVAGAVVVLGLVLVRRRLRSGGPGGAAHARDRSPAHVS